MLYSLKFWSRDWRKIKEVQGNKFYHLGLKKIKGGELCKVYKIYIPTWRSLVGEKPHDSRYLSSITKITLCAREPSWPCPHRSKTPLLASNIRNFLSLQLVTICVPGINFSEFGEWRKFSKIYSFEVSKLSTINEKYKISFWKNTE